MARTLSSPTWWDLLQWVYLTLRRENKHYTSNRPLTAQRIRASLRPTVDRPVFVLGAPRSGTTFLGRCIGALPSVSYHFEPMATKSAAEYVYRGDWDEQNAGRFYRFVYRMLLRLHLDGDCRFAEKTPRNCFIIPFLRRTFPSAQFVFIVRDGRDAALSHSKKPWLRPEGESTLETGSHQFGAYPRFWVEPDRKEAFRSTTTFHRCVWAWRRHVEAALEALDAVPEADQCRLQYEEFVRHPHREADRLLDALGIADANEREALHAVAHEAHADSVGAWTAELTVEQRRRVHHEAGPVLERLGYRVGQADAASI